MKKILLGLLIITPFFGNAQTKIASWYFDATDVAPNTPKVLSADVGAGTIYFDGTNGASLWETATTGNELSSFAGTANNDDRITKVAGQAIGLTAGTGLSANGKSLVIKFSTLNKLDISLSFSIRGTGTGFSTHQWAYSINGTDFTNFGSNTADNSSTFLTKTLGMSEIDAIENLANVYLRLTVSGASNVNGTNRIDNVIITSAATLPISLTSFTAKPVDKTILLNWKTASETNNKSFELQRSADGKNFTTITTLDGAGNSDSEKNYSFVDENPFAGTNYYKLVQYDVNGQSSSKTISVDSKLETAQVFVSATNSSVDLNISSPNFTKATVYLYDLEGSKIAEQGLSLSKGNNALSIAQSLTPGIYFVSLVTDEARINAKFAKW